MVELNVVVVMPTIIPIKSAIVTMHTASYKKIVSFWRFVRPMARKTPDSQACSLTFCEKDAVIMKKDSVRVSSVMKAENAYAGKFRVLNKFST